MEADEAPGREGESERTSVAGDLDSRHNFFAFGPLKSGMSHADQSIWLGVLTPPTYHPASQRHFPVFRKRMIGKHLTHHY